jgi:hypothetical protein
MCQMSLTQDDEVIDPAHMSKASGFQKYASAAYDYEKGELIGWDAVYAVLDTQGNFEEIKTDLNKKYKNLVKKGQYTVKEDEGENKFILSDSIANISHKVLLVEGENGMVRFEGIPKKFEYELNLFKDEELRANPLLALQSMIRAAEDHERFTPGGM